MRLGAILAGGQARRFGSDKAQALIAGETLLARVARHLRPQVDVLVVVGRDWPGLVRVEDRPLGGHGPLAGLAGALAYAAATGCTEVLTSGCDLPDLPANLATLLHPGPAVLAGQPLLGLWPAALGPALDQHLTMTGDRSLRGWIGAVAARVVPAPYPIANINTPAELAAFLRLSADPRSSR